MKKGLVSVSALAGLAAWLGTATAQELDTYPVQYQPAGVASHAEAPIPRPRRDNSSADVAAFSYPSAVGAPSRGPSAAEVSMADASVNRASFIEASFAETSAAAEGGCSTSGCSHCCPSHCS